MHIVWLYNERGKANDENEQCFCVGEEKEEKEGREGDDRGGNNGQISHCSSDPRSLAPQWSSGGTFGATQASRQCVESGLGVCAIASMWWM